MITNVTHFHFYRFQYADILHADYVHIITVIVYLHMMFHTPNLIVSIDILPPLTRETNIALTILVIIVYSRQISLINFHISLVKRHELETLIDRELSACYQYMSSYVNNWENSDNEELCIYI
jgi:hypothetical protein